MFLRMVITTFCHRFLLVAFLFCATATAVFSQSVSLKNGLARVPVTVGPESNAFELHDLTAGRWYTVALAGLPAQQQLDWRYESPEKPTAGVLQHHAGTVRFKAAGPSARLTLASGLAAAHAGWLSVWQEAGLPAKNAPLPDNPPAIIASPAISPQQLVQELFGALSNCYEISNVSAIGHPMTRGRFTNGSSTIGMAEGVVLATAPVDFITGPNTQGNAGSGVGILYPPDPQVAMLAVGNQFDLSVLEFDVKSSLPNLTFQFVFASEEYCEFVNTGFNDVFGLFVNNQNIALVPGTSLPVAVNSVNHLLNGQYYVNNTSMSVCSGWPQYNPVDIQFDGWTKILTATIAVQPGVTNHVKLAIADLNDAIYGSAVFIRGVTPAGSVVPALVYDEAYEGCPANLIRFSRANTNTTQPLTVNFTVGGTATPGVDYAPLNSPVVIPPGQTEVVLPVNVFNDGVTEQPETITVTVADACGGSQVLQLSVLDPAPLTVTLADVTVCPAAPVILSPVVSGAGPYIYAWGTGETGPFMVVNQPGNYCVTVTSACGQTAEVCAKVTFASAPIALARQFCAGTSITLFGQTYSAPGVYTYQAAGQNGQCDTVITITLTEVTEITDTVTLTLCPYDSVTLGGTAYTAPATVNVVHPGLNGACDTVITHVLVPALTGTTQSIATLTCPADITVSLDADAPLVPVSYDLPEATTDCPCPAVPVVQTAGLPPGSVFPLGDTDNCFQAVDACGDTATCCFTVRVEEKPACDVESNGCVTWELLDVTPVATGTRYRIRITNNCPASMINAIFQLPAGLTAVSPANGTIYTSVSGRKYWINNPNGSTFYSIRFNAAQPGISGGQSDVLEYVLPAVAQMAFIQAQVRIAPKTYYTVLLDTFGCDGAGSRDADAADDAPR